MEKAEVSEAERGEITQSKFVCETVKGSHRYTVKGYLLAKGMGPGKYMASDTFAVGGYEWAVYFYPDGKNPEDDSLYVSVFVALASKGTDVRALFELTLVDQSGKGKHKVHSHFGRSLESGPYTLKYRGSMWGYKCFYRRTSLETSDYLKDDCLVINCTVGVVRSRVETPRQFTISVPPPNMGDCLEGLLSSGIASDIAFEVRDETFKAHKLILAARSPVFKAQLFGLIGNPDMDKIVVEDIEPPVFKAMLVFMYSDVLPDVLKLTGSVSMDTSTNMVQHLFLAADRYGLERLKLLCEAKLCEGISADTVASTMALAEQYQCAHLKAICLKFTAARVYLGDDDDFEDAPIHGKDKGQPSSSEMKTIRKSARKRRIVQEVEEGIEREPPTSEQRMLEKVVEEEVMKESLHDNTDEKECKKSEESIYVRVSPKLFVKMILNMTDAQKQWVRLTGFGCLLDFNIRDVPRKLGYKIVQSFDHASVKMLLPNGDIKITEKDVREVLGLPLGSKEIDRSKRNIEIENLWRDQFSVNQGHKVTAKMVLRKLVENREVDLLYKLNFLVILSNAFIQSNANAFVNQNILRFAGNLDKCADYNWCNLVIDGLLEATPVWKKDPSTRLYAGPLLFLMIFYVDRVVYQGRRTVTRGKPTWVGWTEKFLKERSTVELSTNSFGRGVIEKGQWEEEIENVKEKMCKGLNFFEGDTEVRLEDGNIEKDCLQRLESSASRLIQAISAFKAEMSSCRSRIPNHPRLNEINMMVTKMMKSLLYSGNGKSVDNMCKAESFHEKEKVAKKRKVVHREDDDKVGKRKKELVLQEEDSGKKEKN